MTPEKGRIKLIYPGVCMYDIRISVLYLECFRRDRKYSVPNHFM